MRISVCHGCGIILKNPTIAESLQEVHDIFDKLISEGWQKEDALQTISAFIGVNIEIVRNVVDTQPEHKQGGK